MKFIFNNTDRAVACGFRPKCGIPSCCIIRRASPLATSVPCACATANSLPSKSRSNSMPRPLGDSTGTCAGYRGALVGTLWLSRTMPGITMPACIRNGERLRNRNSSCSSFLPIVPTLTQLNGSGNSCDAFASTTGTSRNSVVSLPQWRRNLSSGGQGVERSPNSVACLNIRNYL